MGGHVNMAVSSVPPAVPLVRSGKLRALAVTSRVRSQRCPHVPTMAELGFAGYEFNTWVGVAVPKGTPKEIVDRLREGLVGALAASEVQAALRDQGAVPVGSTASSSGNSCAMKWRRATGSSRRQASSRNDDAARGDIVYRGRMTRSRHRRVILIVCDGLGAEWIGEARTPTLAKLQAAT